MAQDIKALSDAMSNIAEAFKVMATNIEAARDNIQRLAPSDDAARDLIQQLAPFNDADRIGQAMEHINTVKDDLASVKVTQAEHDTSIREMRSHILGHTKELIRLYVNLPHALVPGNKYLEILVVNL